MEKLEKSLNRILIKDSNSNGRVTKLKESIEKVKNGKLILPGVDMSKIKHFIPIILFEKSPPMHRRLWHLYENFIVGNGIADKKFTDDLDFWDVEEIEMILADVEKGHSMPDILKEKEDSGFYKDSIRNFYILKRKHFDKHSLVEANFKTITKRINKILFNKEHA